MKPFIILFLYAAILLSSGLGQDSFSQVKKEKIKGEVKKEETKKSEIKNESKDEVAGKTEDGKMVYVGPKGGFYYLTSGGNKSYIKESELVGAKIVGKTKDGKNIYEGPRGGRYYYNSSNENLT